jgi:chromosome segregation protein
LFKLKRVELQGFKSFADRTRLEFADGVAGVVGPNGCGKSNLSDAISWVLGEQSARVLRGERMADVIFNGTGTRPPTGMAEVSLTLIDPEYFEAPAIEGELPAEGADGTPSDSVPAPEGSNGNGAHAPAAPAKLRHRAGEITVTRRLFRSGESEYLINGELSRLRDIQDLFMGTGLGPESYAIIEQGRIGQILSSKPSDRRAIIEEAAGVSKFKTRKRLAEAKLESSRLNLARITDILEEVSKQVNSLKRQASKARRYRELQRELRARLKVVLASRLVALDSECARLKEEVQKLDAQCSALTLRLEALEQEQKQVALRSDELERGTTEIRDRLARIELEKQRLESAIEQGRHEIAGLASRIAEAQAEAAKLKTQTAALDQEALELERRAAELRTDTQAGRDALRRLTEEKERLAKEVSEGETRVESLRQELIGAVSRMADLRNQLVQAEESGLALDRQRARTQSELSSVEEGRLRLCRELESLTAEHSQGEGALRELANSVAETTAALNRARQEEAAHRTELDGLRQEYSRATARKSVLHDSLARHSYTAESVRRLLSGEIASNGHGFKPLGILADFVEVLPGYEEVVEEFLKTDLECVVVEEHETARSGIALLKSEGAGRSTFFVKHVPSSGPRHGQADSPVRGEHGVRASVRDLVRFEPKLGLNGDLALPALENAYLVEDASTAERLAAKYPDGQFLTPSGEHYHHRLVSGGRGTSAGPLALRRESRELEPRIAELESALRTSQRALEESLARVASFEKDLTVLGEKKLEAEKREVLSSEKLRQMNEESGRAAERLRVLRSEAAHLDEERSALRVREGELRARLNRAVEEQKQWETEIQLAADSLKALRAELDRRLQELTQEQAHAGVLEERLRAREAERARLSADREVLGARSTRLSEQIREWGQEQIRWEDECRKATARRADLDTERLRAETELAALDEESATTRARRDQIASALEAERAALDVARDERSALRENLIRAESDRDHHRARARDEAGVEASQLLQELPPDGALSGEPLRAAEQEVGQIKGRIEGLGAVNMAALEDLQEAEERLGFLETQRQDLLASIEDTTEAIREIDHVSRQQFLEAFQAINLNFAESFKALFGGGVGEMRLSDEADSESGIDIAAQPPGKRLQNVLLLSGGEKALAALALLIAIFRYTPSPFCILDEVDAPLDESNVDRFTGMIQHMSRHTQFILITHNKRTMDIARLLYGVTMEEAGVSRMVSVKLEEHALEPEAVPA